MVPPDVLLSHLAALAAVWAVVLVAGVPACAALRVRLGFPGHALMGLVYWAIALYVFRFDGGLAVAGALALAGFAAVIFRDRPVRFPHPAYLRAAVILGVGCGAYATVLLRDYVPFGADSGMVGASCRLIADHLGLPADYAPWFPDLYFPAVNLALPTVGGVAVALGCEPASVVLALAVLAYAAWILAAYCVLRLWSPPATAAVLAVAQAWGSRWAQNTIGWGGFTTVAGVAAGLFAARLMWDAGRRRTARSAVALGLAAGAVPLVHGVSAAVWVYAFAPALAVVVLVRSPHPRRTAATLLLAAATGAVVLAVYLLAGQVHMSPAELAWSRDHITSDAPQSGVAACLGYLAKFGGDAVAVLGVVAWVGMLALGAWRAALGVAACLALLTVILANAHWWALPFSMMLYPNRAVYWLGPLAAAAVSLALSAGRRKFPGVAAPRVGVVAALLLLAVGLAQHVNQYQRIVWKPLVGRDGWEALRWCDGNLTAPGTFVRATYGSLGSFLPSCAGVATDAWQVNHCAMDESRSALARRRPTHQMCVRGIDPDPPAGARVVFRNAAVTIVELEPAGVSQARRE